MKREEMVSPALCWHYTRESRGNKERDERGTTPYLPSSDWAMLANSLIFFFLGKITLLYL